MPPIAARVAALPWNGWQGSSGIRTCAVKIEEMDVSNGPVGSIGQRNILSLIVEKRMLPMKYRTRINYTESAG